MQFTAKICKCSQYKCHSKDLKNKSMLVKLNYITPDIFRAKIITNSKSHIFRHDRSIKVDKNLQFFWHPYGWNFTIFFDSILLNTTLGLIGMKYSRIGIKSVFIFLKKFVFQIFLSRLILVSIIVEKVKNISSVKGKILLTYKKAKI